MLIEFDTGLGIQDAEALFFFSVLSALIAKYRNIRPLLRLLSFFLARCIVETPIGTISASNGAVL